jgi:HK97 family phage prohead protease
MKTNLERRFVSSAPTMTTVQDGTADTVTGYAALFNNRSQDLGGFVEQIAPGAFTKTIQEADVASLFNHDSSKPLGRVSAGNLKLTTDKTGLRMELTPNLLISWVQDAIEAIRSGLVTQMSFAFRTINDSWDVVGNQLVRTLLEVQLIEVSPVTFPAYLDTSVQVNSVRSYLESIAYPGDKIKQIEFLRSIKSDESTPPPIDTVVADDWKERLEKEKERLWSLL